MISVVLVTGLRDVRARSTNYVTILFNIFCGHKLIKLNEWHLFQLHSFLFHLSPAKYNRSLSHSWSATDEWNQWTYTGWDYYYYYFSLLLKISLTCKWVDWFERNYGEQMPRIGRHRTIVRSFDRSFVHIIIIDVATTIDCMCRISHSHSNGFELIATWTKFNENADNVWRDRAIWAEKYSNYDEFE